MSHINTHCQFPLNAHSSHIHAHTLTFSLMYTPLTFIHPHSLCPRNTPLRFSHTHSLPLMQIPLTFTIYHSLHCNFQQITLLPDSLTHPLTVSHKYHSFNIHKHTHSSFNLMHTSLTLYHPNSNSLTLRHTNHSQMYTLSTHSLSAPSHILSSSHSTLSLNAPHTPN